MTIWQHGLTYEEERAVRVALFKAARRGDPHAIGELDRLYDARIWTAYEVAALNAHDLYQAGAV